MRRYRNNWRNWAGNCNGNLAANPAAAKTCI
jgi:hypothetical protein